MRKKVLALCAILWILPGISRAQGTVNELESDLGARVSLTADKKISKGFHWNVEGEARMSENFSDLGRYQIGTGLTYKVSPWLKLGAGYIFIQKKNSDDEWKDRHRFYGDATFSYKTGPWKLALKERLQLTHRDVGNVYQNNPNSLTLKSRFKVSYNASPTLTPYGYIELRNVFNDPACDALWSTTSRAYAGYSFLGYTDTYLNRLRGSLGADWKLDKHNALDLFVMADYCHDKNIDTNKAGTKLKSLTYDRKINLGLGIGYKFSF
mgnify:CR=1 FL=1